MAAAANKAMLLRGFTSIRDVGWPSIGIKMASGSITGAHDPQDVTEYMLEDTTLLADPEKNLKLIMKNG